MNVNEIKELIEDLPDELIEIINEMDFENPLEIISFANLLIKIGSDISLKLNLELILQDKNLKEKYSKKITNNKKE